MVGIDTSSLRARKQSPRLSSPHPAKKVSGTTPGKPPSAAKRKKAAPTSPSRNGRGKDLVSESSSMVLSTGTGIHRRRQKPLQVSDKDREEMLARKEDELGRLSESLELRTKTLEQKETEASALLSQVALKMQEPLLKQLEEHFTCSLCYEVLAAPYSLNPSRCGHTFCGLCILGWFFSRLHRHCGTWHESVGCPMCRSPLIITPERIPRLQLTFPFVPNRIAASVIESLVAKLVQQPQPSRAKIEKEEGDNTCNSKLRKRCHPNRRNQNTTKSNLILGSSEDSGLSAWREDGHMRKDWLKKDREGREEMEYLLNSWSTMQPQDFIAMKVKLGV